MQKNDNVLISLCNKQRKINNEDFEDLPESIDSRIKIGIMKRSMCHSSIKLLYGCTINCAALLQHCNLSWAEMG